LAFVGEFEYAMDPKARVILPAPLREGFNGHAYVSCYTDGCLAVWALEEFERRYIARARRLDRRGREGRDIARAMASQASYVDIDAQWRLLIGPNLREYARLQPDSRLKIVGAINHIELWEPERWRDRLEPGLAILRSGSGLFDEEEDDFDEVAGAAAQLAPAGVPGGAT
jgi:transcriptional regulator MraZ